MRRAEVRSARIPQIAGIVGRSAELRGKWSTGRTGTSRRGTRVDATLHPGGTTVDGAVEAGRVGEAAHALVLGIKHMIGHLVRCQNVHAGETGIGVEAGVGLEKDFVARS